MTENGYPRMEELCRLCLTPMDEQNLIRIFPQEASTHMSIPARIMACVGLDVQPNDELPQSICSECRYHLERSYYMRKRSQATDSKLRKHLRLLALGKKSRVFAKTDDENFEDELEFEDSIQFLKEHDEVKKRKNMEQQLRNEIIETLREEIRQEIREEVVDEVRRDLRNEILQEIDTELRVEVEQEVREVLRAECIELAKVELRQEVRGECRREEMKELLDELELFLHEKRAIKEGNMTVLIPSIGKGEKSQLSSKSDHITNKAMPTDEQNLPTIVERSSSRPLDGAANNFKLIPAQLSFADLKGTEAEHENESNFYIVDADVVTEEANAPDSQPDDNSQDEEDASFYDTDMDGESFNLATSEQSTSDTTSYKINMDGIRVYKKASPATRAKLEIQEPIAESDDVIVFNFGQQIDIDSNYDGVTIEEMAPKSVSLEDEDVIVDNSSEEVVPTKEPPFTKRITANSFNATDALESAPSLHRLTDTVKTFKCQSCPRAFSTLGSFERHMETHRKAEKDGGISYQCPECQIMVSCRSALTRHMIIHTGMRPHKCTFCDKSFVQREILKRHLQTHTGERAHHCPHCDRSFTQKANLNQHINKTHMEEPKLRQHKCHLCPKRFNHASGLSRHLASHGGVLFQCTKCTRSFGDRSSVKRHCNMCKGRAPVE